MNLKLRSMLCATAAFSVLLATASAGFAANAKPIVDTFIVAPSSLSPVTVTSFTAHDTDGTVVGYMCTESSTAPLPSDTHWTSTAPQSCATTKTGSQTLYAWAKDNLGAVSTAKTATTWEVGTHQHVIADVANLQTTLDEKAALDHNHDAVYQKKYGKVAVVAVTGGDYANPAAALADVANWCGTPSAAAPCLLKLMPGVYDIGGQSVVIPSGMDLEGSGEAVTKISGHGVMMIELRDGEIRSVTLEHFATYGSGYQGTGALYLAGADSTLSNVTVRETNVGNGYVTAISSGQARVIMTNVAVTADGGGVGLPINGIWLGSLPTSGDQASSLNNVSIRVSNGGAAIGLNTQYGTGAQVYFNNLKIDVSSLPPNGCYGIAGSNFRLANSDVHAAYMAFVVGGGNVTVVNSRIAGDTNSLVLQGGTANVAFSEIDGPIAGAPTCFNVHDAAFNSIACQ
jgi:hypothetical protein